MLAMEKGLQTVPHVIQQTAKEYPLRYTGGIFPIYQADVPRERYKIAKFASDFLKTEDFRRAMGEESKRLDKNFEGPYTEIGTERFTIESSVDWAELEGVDDLLVSRLMLQERRTKASYEKLFNSIEAEQITAALKELNYDGNVAAPAGNTKWDQNDTDVLAQIKEAKKEIQFKIGRKPNMITISEPVWEKLRLKKNLLDKLPNTVLRAGLTPEDFGSLCGISHVVIADTMVKENGALVYAWGKNVQLCYNPEEILDVKNGPFFGITVLRPMAQPDIRMYSDEARSSEITAIDRYLGWGIVNPSAGFLFKDVVA